MTNREEIEKKFDERFGDLGKLDIYEGGIAVGYVNNNEQIKSFFFDEILPEVFNDLLPEKITNNIDDEDFAHHILKVKEKYNITL